MGRCGDLEDELGSRIIAARLVRDLMKLGFLLKSSMRPTANGWGRLLRGLNVGRS
jgi:hypothetical protein